MQQMIDAKGGTQKLAEAIGSSESVVRKWRTGQSEPTMRYLRLLSDATQRSLDWIVYGQETAIHNHTQIKEHPASYSNDQFIVIRRYDVTASAGPGIASISEDEIDGIAFRADWLRSRGFTPSKLAVISVRGDSMEPTLKNGALVLVDTSETSRVSDGIYIINVDGALMAKRIQLGISNGEIMIRSDNPAYAQITLDQTQISAIRIVGRAVWAGSEI